MSKIDEKNALLDEEEMMALLATNTNINLIADVITPFHLIGVFAYLFYLNIEKNIEPIGIIRIHPHVETGYSIDFDKLKLNTCGFSQVKICYAPQLDRENTCMNFLCTCFKALKGTKKLTKRRRNGVLYFLDAGVPLLRAIRSLVHTNKSVAIVSLDDGNGSFEGRLFWAKHIAQLRCSVFAGIKHYCLDYAYDILRYVYHVEIINFQMFSRKNFFNENIVKYYKKAIESGLFDASFSFQGKYAFYLSRPLSNENMQDAIKGLLTAITNYGITIFIKPHPRENSKNQLFKQDFSMIKYIDKEYPIECVIANAQNKPLFVVGDNTTALYTIAAYWSIPCFQICDILARGDISKGVSKIMKIATRKIPSLHYGRELFIYLNSINSIKSSSTN